MRERPFSPARARINLTGDFAEQFDFKSKAISRTAMAFHPAHRFEATDIFVTGTSSPKRISKSPMESAVRFTDYTRPNSCYDRAQSAYRRNHTERQLGVQSGASRLRTCGHRRRTW